MQTHSKSNPASMAFFYGKREGNLNMAPSEFRTQIQPIQGSVFQKRTRNSEKADRIGACERHPMAPETFCPGCRKPACTSCLQTGEHLRVCPLHRTPGKPIAMTPSPIEIRSKLNVAYEKACNDLQLSQITTVSHIEGNFNEFIFEIERNKKAAVEGAKDHFLSASRRLEVLRFEAESVLKRQTNRAQFLTDVQQIEANLRQAISALGNFVTENRLVFDFDKSKIDLAKSYYRMSVNAATILDEPNLLSMSVDNDDYVSIMGNSKANSVVFDQHSRDSNVLGERMTKQNMRQTASSRKKRPESKTEAGSLFNNKIDRNSTHFQSVYAGIVKDKVGKRLAFNKENLTGRCMVNQSASITGGSPGQPMSDIDGLFTPKFLDPRIDDAIADKLGQKPREAALPKNESKKDLCPPTPQNTEVEDLNLAGLGLTATGILERIHGLRTPSRLRVLDISNNDLEDRGLKQILKGLTNLKVEELVCRKCRLTELSLDYFVSFRKYNQSMKHVVMFDNVIPDPKALAPKRSRIMKECGIAIEC